MPLCQCENSTQDNIVLERHLFPREVSVRAEAHNTELLDYLQLPNICFLPLYVKTKRVISLYKQGDYYSAVVRSTAISCCFSCTLWWWDCVSTALRRTVGKHMVWKFTLLYKAHMPWAICMCSNSAAQKWFTLMFPLNYYTAREMTKKGLCCTVEVN